MLIEKTRTSCKSDKIKLKLGKDQYTFWQDFCDYHLQLCSSNLEKSGQNKDHSEKLHSEREILESIMFHVDVCSADPTCTVEVPRHFLIVLANRVRDWRFTLYQALDDKRGMLKTVRNGEDKRQLSNEMFKIQENLRILAAVSVKLKHFFL